VAATRTELHRREFLRAVVHRLDRCAPRQLQRTRYQREIETKYPARDSSSRSVLRAYRRCCRWPKPRCSSIGLRSRLSFPVLAPESRRQERTNPRTPEQCTFLTMCASLQCTFLTLCASLSRRIKNDGIQHPCLARKRRAFCISPSTSRFLFSACRDAWRNPSLHLRGNLYAQCNAQSHRIDDRSFRTDPVDDQRAGAPNNNDACARLGTAVAV